MSSPINAIYNGTFTVGATAAAVTLSLPSGANEFDLVNITDINTPDVGATTQVMTAKGYSFLTPGAAIVAHKTNGAATLGTTNYIATAGFTFFDDSGLVANGAIVTTAAPVGVITQANGAVVTSGTVATVGSVVRMFNTTAMLQISGMDFTVTASAPGAPGTFTLGYLNSAAFADAGTANSFVTLPFSGSVSSAIGTSTLISPNPRFYPRNRYVTGITAAAQAVVSLSVSHNYQVGEKVRMIVPAEFGMTQMNGLLGTIVAVSYGTVGVGTNTITLDIDSSGFTAFAFPTSAKAAGGINFAQCVPVGEAAINTIALPVANRLDDRTRNTSVRGVIIDASLLTANKTYSWIAKKGLTI